MFEEMKRRGVEQYGADAVASVLAQPVTAHRDLTVAQMTVAQLYVAALGEAVQ